MAETLQNCCKNKNKFRFRQGVVKNTAGQSGLVFDDILVKTLHYGKPLGVLCPVDGCITFSSRWRSLSFGKGVYQIKSKLSHRQRVRSISTICTLSQLNTNDEPVGQSVRSREEIGYSGFEYNICVQEFSLLLYSASPPRKHQLKLFFVHSDD
jgi:hypothetical protein